MTSALAVLLPTYELYMACYGFPFIGVLIGYLKISYVKSFGIAIFTLFVIVGVEWAINSFMLATLVANTLTK